MKQIIIDKTNKIFINLFDVHYDAEPEDLINLYPNVKVSQIFKVKDGNYLFQMNSKEDAIRLVQEGSKVFRK